MVSLLSKHNAANDSFVEKNNVFKEYLKPYKYDIVVLLIKCFAQLSPLTKEYGVQLSTEIMNNLMQFTSSSQEEQFLGGMMWSAIENIDCFKCELSNLSQSEFSQVKLHFL